MTAEWHQPVSAILDHLEVDRVTLAGLSLGGCLVLRAAALEPRVTHLLAFDVLTSFLDVTPRQTHVLLRALLKVLLTLGAARIVETDAQKGQAVGSVIRITGRVLGMKLSGLTHALGLLFGRTYAAWCTRQMTTDAATAFGGNAAS